MYWLQENCYKFTLLLQLRAYCCSIELTSTTQFQLLLMQGRVFSYSATPPALVCSPEDLKFDPRTTAHYS